MWIWCAVALAGVPLALPAGDEVTTDTLIADELAASGDTVAAITAYGELAEQGGAAGARAAWRIGELQLSTGRVDEATWTFQDAATRLEAYRQPLTFGEGMARFTLGQYSGAARAFASIEDRALADAARVFAALSLASLEQTDAALAALAPIEAPPFSYSAASLRAALRTPLPPGPSPVAAGLLSTAVPGMGHFYLGQTRPGLTALLLTGGLGVATALFAADDRPGGALLLGAATLTSWVFSVIFSARAARRIRRDRRAQRAASWRQAHTPQVELISSDDLVLQALPAEAAP